MVPQTGVVIVQGLGNRDGHVLIAHRFESEKAGKVVVSLAHRVHAANVIGEDGQRLRGLGARDFDFQEDAGGGVAKHAVDAGARGTGQGIRDVTAETRGIAETQGLSGIAE